MYTGSSHPPLTLKSIQSSNPAACYEYCGFPHVSRARSTREATLNAIRHPLSPSPPLDRVIVPSDRIAIALETGMPDAPECVSAIVEQLCVAGAHPQNITILRTERECRLADRDPRSSLPEMIAGSVQCMTHRRKAVEKLAYLATTASSHRVYLSRVLSEADVVIPLGTVRPVLGTSLHHANNCWFPRFSDSATWERFHPRIPRNLESLDELRSESEEVAWLLGIQFLVLGIPGGDIPLRDIVAGRTAELQDDGWNRFKTVWHHPLLERLPFAIANISGRASEQSWPNLARVLLKAQGVLSDNGVLAICCNLQETPRRELQMLLKQNDTKPHKQRHGPSDHESLLVQSIRHATDNWRVYLLSNLPQSVVESLRMIPVEKTTELQRLMSQHDRGLLWENAQYALPTVENGSSPDSDPE